MVIRYQNTVFNLQHISLFQISLSYFCILLSHLKKIEEFVIILIEIVK